ncbi:iron ABC transporter permease [Halomonas sp. LC1]|uniref:FecCD family ABC transporter permease n=1 Tax=Halomonas sp. LC1 TaxID=3043733 RepID=UPI0025578E1D|nr:iron ABC transporter permease [Halomonas sp. LC1]MDK9687111.1 iron ABC transporter permease [Halomonas sp. LC1]
MTTFRTAFHGPRQLRLRSRGQRIALLLPLRSLIVLLGLAVALLAVIGISVANGSYPVPLAEVFAALTGSDAVDPQMALIVREFRLPRSLAAALAGVLFAVSGACLQAITRNPLADPSLVGVSQGAGVAVLIVLVALPVIPVSAVPLAAMLGAFVVVGLMYALAGRDGGNTVRFILTGIGVGAFLGAVSSLLITYGELERVMTAMVWLAGSVHAAGWGDVALLATWVALVLPVMLSASRGLNAMLLGEATAVGLGLPVRRVLVITVVAAVAAAAGAVSAVGTLGFVGLVAPHVARLLVGERQGMLLVASALVGAVLVAAADMIGRLAFAPVQLPAGIVTALIGVPYFIALLWQRRHSL